MPELPLVMAARATETGQKIETFFKAPVWRAEGETVIAFDLRFRFAVLGNDWDPFGFCFRLDGNRLALVDESLGNYLTNWLSALLKFGPTQSTAQINACAAEQTVLTAVAK
jgi:hypothetical protein